MENYFWNTEIGSEEKKVYILIIYDIVDKKRRLKMAKKLESYGFRIQKSAFEAIINEKLYNKLIKEIPVFMDKSEDSVRIYKIYGRGEVLNFGIAKEITNEEVIVI